MLLIEQEAVRMEMWSRGPVGWACIPLGPDDIAVLDALGVEIPVAEVYEGSERFPS